MEDYNEEKPNKASGLAAAIAVIAILFAVVCFCGVAILEVIKKASEL